MIPTIYGVLVIGAAIFLMGQPVSYLLILTLACTILGDASAINMPMLGGSSVLTAYVALGCLIVRLIASPKFSSAEFSNVAGQDIYLVLYGLYGAATAFILPRLFAGTIDLVPLRPPTQRLFDLYPLHFSSQNITTALYLLGTLAMSLATALVLRKEGRFNLIVKAAIFLSWLHVVIGLLDLGFTKIGHADFLNFLRTANYDKHFGYFAPPSQNNMFQRIAGSFPETSGYSAFGLAFLVFMIELWIRNIMSRQTGLAAIGLFFVLCLTTSTTAYICLLLIAVILVARALFTPMRIPFSKALNIGLFLLICSTVALGIAIFFPSLFSTFDAMVQAMTIGKVGSKSGVQRALWASQGLKAFVSTYGIGVGSGSFRSSSLVSAVLGSVGLIGFSLLLANIFSVLRPFKMVTHDVQTAGVSAIGGAAGWAAILSLLPAVLVAPSADPGLIYGFLAGVAMASRRPEYNAPVRLPSRSAPKAVS